MCERQALKGSHCKRPPTFVKQCFGRTEWKGPTWSVLLLMRPKGDVFEKLQFRGRAAFEFYGSMSCGFKDSADYSENHKNISGCGSSIMPCFCITKIEFRFQTNWIVNFMTSNEVWSTVRNRNPSKAFTGKMRKSSSRKSFKFNFASFAPSLLHQKNIPTAIQPAMKNQTETS